MQKSNHLVLWLKEFRLEKEAGIFAAYCDELGLSSCGNSEREAVENLTHAIESYIESIKKLPDFKQRLIDKGVLYQYLLTIENDKTMPVLVKI